ncbi:DUF6388 family protein [Halomonas sp. SIMBA_159]
MNQSTSIQNDIIRQGADILLKANPQLQVQAEREFQIIPGLEEEEVEQILAARRMSIHGALQAEADARGYNSALEFAMVLAQTPEPQATEILTGYYRKIAEGVGYSLDEFLADNPAIRRRLRGE